MSLINQMLQELDARRADATGAGPFGQQIRAVPERQGIHRAWWVALALAGVLTGMLAWLLLRAPAPVAVPGPKAQLPLKLDFDLNAVPSSQISVTQEKPAEAAVAEPKMIVQDPPVETAPPTVVQRNEETPTKTLPATSVSAPKPSQAVKQAVPMLDVKKAPVAPAPELAKVVPTTKALVGRPAATTSDSTAPVVINKQFKELTPQQGAENEYRKAAQSIQQGKTSDAVSSLEQALQLNPMHAAARQTLIGILLENKHKDGAMRRAQDGLFLDVAQPGLAMILARLQLEKGELRQAIDTLERTLPYAVDHADYQAFLGALLQRAERHKEAAEHYLHALQRVPQNGVWWMGLGISFQAERRMPEAQEAFKRAKATNTLSPELQAFVELRLAQLQR